MGEGLTLPALHHVTARWAPVHERSRFVTISVSGQYLGTSATLLCAPMVHEWWPSIFYIFGSLGVVWVVVWVLIGGDSAEKHRYIGDAEKAYIAESIPTILQVESVPWRKLCCEPAFIAVCVCHFCVNWANFFTISWLPKYLVDVVGLSLAESGHALLIPYMMPFLGVLFAGQASDALIQRGWKVRQCSLLLAAVQWSQLVSLLTSNNLLRHRWRMSERSCKPHPTSCRADVLCTSSSCQSRPLKLSRLSWRLPASSRAFTSPGTGRISSTLGPDGQDR